jgi:carboxylesterase type B
MFVFCQVFVPLGNAKAPEEGYSTMIWIYGGSFTSGAGNSFDGELLSYQTNTIVVTFNYRVGALGLSIDFL